MTEWWIWRWKWYDRRSHVRWARCPVRNGCFVTEIWYSARNVASHFIYIRSFTLQLWKYVMNSTYHINFSLRIYRVGHTTVCHSSFNYYEKKIQLHFSKQERNEIRDKEFVEQKIITNIADIPTTGTNTENDSCQHWARKNYEFFCSAHRSTIIIVIWKESLKCGSSALNFRLMSTRNIQ